MLWKHVLDPNEPIDGIDGIDGFSPVPGPELFFGLYSKPPESNSINSVNRFFGIENRLLDLVDAFNANGAHTKAASSPFLVLWKHVFWTPMNRLTELMELMGFLRSRVRSCFWPLLQAPGGPQRTINSVNQSVLRDRKTSSRPR